MATNKSLNDAKAALAAHAGVDYVVGDSPHMIYRLIADLAHLAEYGGLDIAWIMEKAAVTYETERQQGSAES